MKGVCSWQDNQTAFDYNDDAIQVLEGLEAVRKTSWDVYWKHGFKRITSSRL